MDAPPLVLDVVAQTVLNASGNGTVRLGPTSTRQTWVVDLAVVSTSTNVSEPVAELFLNSKASRLGGTYTGSNDQMGPNTTVRNGKILCVWTGGDPGAIATLNLHGQIIIGG